MRLKRYFNKRNVLAALLASGLFACGSATNNDQGASVTFLGFFQAAPTSGSTELPAGDAGDYIVLSDFTNDGGVPEVNKFLGFQNNLTQQGMRIRRVNLEFIISGASENPPSSSQPVSAIMGPFVEEDSDSGAGSGFDGSLPGGIGSLPNRSFVEVAIVPAPVLEWINFNRGSLPEPPFLMTVLVSAEGATIPAGDSLETQVEAFPITFTSDVPINPGGSSDESAG